MQTSYLESSPTVDIVPTSPMPCISDDAKVSLLCCSKSGKSPGNYDREQRLASEATMTTSPINPQ